MYECVVAERTPLPLRLFYVCMHMYVLHRIAKGIMHKYLTLSLTQDASARYLVVRPMLRNKQWQTHTLQHIVIETSFSSAWYSSESTHIPSQSWRETEKGWWWGSGVEEPECAVGLDGSATAQKMTTDGSRRGFTATTQHLESINVREKFLIIIFVLNNHNVIRLKPNGTHDEFVINENFLLN